MELKYKTVKDGLMYIQKNEKEEHLFPILKQLFIKMGFKDVYINHGTSEYGKDLVFNKIDEIIGHEEWFAAVVKNKNGGDKDFEQGGEIARQIDSAFKVRYEDNKGSKIGINKVFVIINGTISNNAKTILQEYYPASELNNVIFWNYQDLETKITQYIKDWFLSGNCTNPDDIAISCYKENMIKKLSSLDNAQEVFSGYSISDINDIFVNVRTANKKYENEKKRYQEVGKFAYKEELDESIAIINSNKNTVIKGIPTSGKTLMLKRIGINALEKYPKIGIFWFRFRDIDIKTFSIEEEVQKQFLSFSENNELKDSYFDRILILFDALDEIADSDRKEILPKINVQSIGSIKCNIIITGRNIDLFDDKELFKDFESFDLLPFDIGQALKLVKKIIPNDKQKSTQFISAIKSQQLSNSLTRTPMALTLMAIMYKDDAIDLKELPANITELYSKFSDYYLDKWDATKGLSSQYKYEENKHVMGFIAEYMHRNNLYRLSVSEMRDFLQGLKQKYSFEELSDISAFIEKTKTRNSLLCYDRCSDDFYFTSISFQEYFASIYFDDTNEKYLLDQIYNDWWQNVIVFYNGKNPKRGAFIEKVIKYSIPVDPATKFNHMQVLSKCLQAAHIVPNDIEKKGIENIIDVFDSFYKSIIETAENNNSIAYSWTTLDVIIQCRNLFAQLFASKHINADIFSEIALELLSETKCDNYSDVTLYCLAFHLVHLTNDADYFVEFLKKPNLNTRWDRIVYRDIEYMRLKSKVPQNVYNRIKRKQEYNKIYIDQQFKEIAILHLADGTKLLNS